MDGTMTSKDRPDSLVGDLEKKRLCFHLFPIVMCHKIQHRPYDCEDEQEQKGSLHDTASVRRWWLVDFLVTVSCWL